MLRLLGVTEKVHSLTRLLNTLIGSDNSTNIALQHCSPIYSRATRPSALR